MEYSISGAYNKRLEHVICDADPRREVVLVGVHLRVPSPTAAGLGSHDRAAVCRRSIGDAGRIGLSSAGEVGGPTFAVQPEWRIKFIAKAVVDGQIRARPPCVLRIE